jgi:hypothetical protein
MVYRRSASLLLPVSLNRWTRPIPARRLRFRPGWGVAPPWRLVTGISNSQVSRLCQEIDEKVKAFLTRAVEGDWPYLWIDANYVEVRESGRIVSAAVIVAGAVKSDGRREVLGKDIGSSEAGTS